jgi:hypothetical protein
MVISDRGKRSWTCGLYNTPRSVSYPLGKRDDICRGQNQRRTGSQKRITMNRTGHFRVMGV